MKFLLQKWVLLLVFLPFSAAAESLSALTIHTEKGPAALRVELAATPEQQQLGLMFRTELAEDSGMLFVFPAPQEISMWMRHTYIPLDMIFIKKDGRILRVEENTTPLSQKIITSGGDSLAVLEVPGGTARRIGAKPGDRVTHEALK